jgi:RNA polymerase sigma-70 factor (ECF subfamily)
MFAVPFDEIAPIIERSPEAARQLASRARRRVQGAAPETDADLPHQREIVDAFLSAARAGDFEALLAVLDPEVVFRADTGPASRLARPPITGAAAVAQQVLARGTRLAPHARPAIVNGTAGVVVVGSGGRPVAVLGFTVARDRIIAMDLITDPDKLRGLVFTG